MSAGDTLPPMAHWQPSAITFFLSSSPPSPSLSRLSVWSSTSSLYFIFCLFIFPFAGVEPSSPPHCCFPSPHVWPLISTSIINWSLISGWLIQEDHNNEDTDNAKKGKKKKKSLCLLPAQMRRPVSCIYSRETVWRARQLCLSTCRQSPCCQLSL